MEITMRAFKGTFKKKNGESRDMLFVFNWATIVSDPKELSIDEGHFT